MVKKKKKSKTMDLRKSLIEDLINYYTVAIKDIKKEKNWLKYLSVNHLHSGICALITDEPQFEKYHPGKIGVCFISGFARVINPSGYCLYWSRCPCWCDTVDEAILSGLIPRLKILKNALKQELWKNGI